MERQEDIKEGGDRERRQREGRKEVRSRLYIATTCVGVVALLCVWWHQEKAR